ncbi:MAG: hypothetical protein K6T85_18265 [Gorillibacterium sp.]|nr:hypothetical protein [Gorillibacterium sp.]
MKYLTAKRTIYGLLVIVLMLSLVTTVSALGNRTEATNTQEKTITVYISSLQINDSLATITADEINWYQGDEADRIFAQKDPEGAAEMGGTLDGYYIVNDEHVLQTYTINDHAQVLMQLYDPYTIKWNQEITLPQLIDVFSHSDIMQQSAIPYHLTLQNGEVTRIVQQYIP